MDLKTLVPRNTVRKIPRPKERIKAIHQAPALKTQIHAQFNLSNIPGKISNQIKKNSIISPSILVSKPNPVSSYVATLVNPLIDGVMGLPITDLPFSIKSGSSDIDQMDAYIASIYGRLGKLRRYPPAAKRRGLEGTVILEFLLYRDGTVGEAKVTKSSNYSILDNAAIKTVRSGDPYPPFPSGVKDDFMWIEVPILYHLTD